MKRLLFLAGMFLAIGAYAQDVLPEMQFTTSDVEAHMRFLASDELEGRRTGSRGNNVAARYIASWFKAYGLQTVPGAENYYQPVPFETVNVPQQATLQIEQTNFTSGKDFLFLSGDAVDVKTTAVFANYGWVDATTGHDDYKKLNVKGKVVFVLPGTPDDQSPQAIFTAGVRKRQLAAERGAVAVIELYRVPFPWGFFVNYFGGESIRLAEAQTGNTPRILYGFFKEPSPNPILEIQNGKKLKIALKASAGSIVPLPSQNVIGVLPGTDPVLKNEYILLSAHYDHVGMGKQGGGAYSPQDSIFNGARDNGFGTVSLLATVKALTENPPARSVIFLAVTGEELGLLGSRYYAENPLIPLEKTVFNLNTDAAGYNDTTNVMIVGIQHVPVREYLEQGAAPFGLGILDDPLPEQNLFVRSDHFSFVSKGVPAIFITPAITEFDEEVTKYYHQVTDGPETINYNYLLKYCQAFAHTARIFANMPERPFWVPGSEYESLGKALYNK
ncbi:MAG TPA: M28 family peptidase [Saprospiraceae bacterium]|nr:M28 family peptidase [Saprospiraceae bacterium]HMP23354.1 M28 family peptidase [Saprospiraceae bacterium]